jgi:2-(1,2-epoxy-1,2-dihydrophenyl)acetyl-CoA isomerase
VSAHVLFSRHGGVGLVTLNRPERLNAFADRMRDELGEIVRGAAADPAIGAIVMTGAGRAFCAGADVARMHELIAGEDWDALETLVEAGASVVRVIDGVGKPVLAAVNGAAAGGGANLALACDIRIAAARASIGQTFCRMGLQPDWGGTFLLPRLVGLGRALELVLTADMLPADEAVRIGLFNRLVDDERVVDETVALAERIAARPPLAVALAKESLRGACALSLPQALDVERAHQLRLFKTPEAREAMRAFLAKRQPAAGGSA